MGCCETRNGILDTQKIPEPALYESYNRPPSPVATEQPKPIIVITEEEKYALLNNFCLSLLEDYISKLISLPIWLSIIERNKIIVQCITGSVFTSKIPVVLAHVDFNFIISCKTIINYICFDRTWDSSIVKYEVKSTDEFFDVVIVKKFPFINRKYYCKVYVKENEKNASVIFIKNNEGKSGLDKDEVGEVVFIVINIQENDEGTALMIVSQVDSKQEISTGLAKMAAQEMYQWLMVLRIRCASNLPQTKQALQ
ncbi:hypothetical protein SteCoe_13467 [Stentor coeruleus]|uniref:START domain-containing protein n=1 Tax=Stentor coeruleus TaxID=5963 RepID=A0A1R2C898_9CILI|nr:hypothetical protein SteCoe_13467 [Stentor coeruleus]